MSHEQEVYLEFKYLKNVVIHFGQAGVLSPPMRMVEMPAEYSQGKKGDWGGEKRGAVVPIFDLNYIHKIPLVDETIPNVAEEVRGASDRLVKELEDDAYLAARKARAENDEIRRIVYHHVKVGNIEVVHDPYGDRLVTTKQGLKKASEFIAAGKKAKPNKSLDKVTIEPDLSQALPVGGEVKAVVL